jgi:dethiobiotin synthetase
MMPKTQSQTQIAQETAAPPPDTPPPAGLFITGTGTGVGKTFVAAAIAQLLHHTGRRVGVYKPVATGLGNPSHALAGSDAELLWNASGRTAALHTVCPQHFFAPAAPPVAAAAQGQTIDAALLYRGATHWRDRCDLLIVEGVGGLLCPLTEHSTIADLVADLAYPLVIVARRDLGTLNHTLLTVEVAHHRGLKLAGVILNTPEPDGASLAECTNAQELRRRIDCPLLVEFPHFPRRFTGDCRSEPPTPPRPHNRYATENNTLSALGLLSRIDWWKLAHTEQANPNSQAAQPGSGPVYS